MKKLLYLAICILTVSTYAQKQIDEGVIISKQTMSSDNEQMNAQLAMLGEMITTTYFKNNKSRSETSNPMAGTTVFIADNAANKSIMFMDNAMLGRKYVEGDVSPSAEDLENIKVEKTNEKKTILGYECIKYNVNMIKDGTDVKMVVYATDKLKAITQQTATFGKDFSGFPLQMTLAVEQQGMKLDLIIEVTEVKAEKVSDDKFDMTPPEGYTKGENIPGM